MGLRLLKADTLRSGIKSWVKALILCSTLLVATPLQLNLNLSLITLILTLMLSNFNMRGVSLG